MSKITKYTLPNAGFFNDELKVNDGFSKNSYMHFMKECLNNRMVLSLLRSNLCSKIINYIDRYNYLFPDRTDSCLVHADFDPSNILVLNTNGAWKISAILDWEFAFSGSVLCDVANMLRYSHDMPDEYETAFLDGLKFGGVNLPKDWCISMYMLTLLSLLDSLKMADPIIRPNQCSDILKLIEHILIKLDIY